MAKVTVKAVVSVEIAEPKSLDKQTTAERNTQIKDEAEARILDALQLSELSPTILRIRIARAEKGEKADE
jgi:hypothetical protein